MSDRLNQHEAESIFNESITTGLNQADIDRTEGLNGEIPKAITYYSQYTNVIGYYGVGSLVRDLNREHRERQFGQPYVIYVSDFSGQQPHVTDLGLIEICSECTPNMTKAENAYFVVDSRAQTIGGESLIVPFSDRADAREFARKADGKIMQWDQVRQSSFNASTRSRSEWQDVVSQRDAWANETVRESRSLLNRRVSVVVGEDAPTLEAAINQAPANTTIRLPPGTYDATGIVVSKPVTILGSGNDTKLQGEADTTSIQFFSSRAAISSVSLVVAGDKTPTEIQYPTNRSDQVDTGYLLEHPALRFYGSASLVDNVFLRPASTGIVFTDSDGSVVHNTTIRGDQPWQEGYVSVLSFRSRLVVQESRFLGGRGALYFHRSNGGVVRDNYMANMRSGLSNVYTSETLVANNTIRETTIGVHALTRQTQNAIIRNDIRTSEIGIGDAGSKNYLSENMLLYNEMGMQIEGSESLYTRNVIAHNREGIHVGRIIEDENHHGTVIPTTRITENDFIENQRHVRTEQVGPLQVWTTNERGNYWSGAPGVDRNGDGTLNREFRVTGTTDSLSYRARGGRTLALSPAVVTLRSLQSLVPGLQASGVLDTAPLASPTHDKANEIRSLSENETIKSDK